MVAPHRYLNLPEKTASVFKPDTLTGGAYPLYKSGDLARYSATGNIEYYGRADSQVRQTSAASSPLYTSELTLYLGTALAVSALCVDEAVREDTGVSKVLDQLTDSCLPLVPRQVKIRGYRVELSEIESVMCEVAGVKSAVVDVQTVGGVKHLVGFVIPTSGSLDIHSMLSLMREKLPVFMIPSHIEVVQDFPTLPSGKVERRRLPRVMERLAAERAAAGASAAGGPSETISRLPRFQKAAALAMEGVLGEGSVSSPRDNFFDLGGNSFLLSRLITNLRAEFPGVTAKDVYVHPTVAGLAAVLEQLAPQVQEERDIHVPTLSQLWTADLVQALAMYFAAAYMGLNSITIYILYFSFSSWPPERLIFLLAAVSLLLMVSAFFVNVAVKWLVLGRAKEGDYPLWGSYHLRFWFVQCIDDLFRAYYSWLFTGTPLLAMYYRAMGIKVGSRVFLHGPVDGFDLVEIGVGATVNLEANVSAVSVEDNYLKLRRVKIGEGATIGIRSVVQGGVTIGDYAKVEAMSLVASGTNIPSRERWAGSPAERTSKPLCNGSLCEVALTTPPIQ